MVYGRVYQIEPYELCPCTKFELFPTEFLSILQLNHSPVPVTKMSENIESLHGFLNHTVNFQYY